MLIFILTSLLSQTNVLVEQDGVQVSIADLDSYVYTLVPEQRVIYAKDKVRIDKSIISLLNMNIVYDYIIESEYGKHDVFQEVIKEFKDQEIVLDIDYINQLGLDKDDFTEHFKHYLTKSEYVKRLKDVLRDNMDSNDLESMSRESFLTRKSSLTVPEKRSLSVILLDKSKYNQAKAVSILTEIINANDKPFSEFALTYSNDSIVKLNKGNWHEFRKKDFNYPFSEAVFSAKMGVIPTVFEYKNHLYLIKIDKIITPVAPDYDDYKEEIMDSIITKIITQKTQNILNSKGISKPEVNADNAVHVFERYKVLKIED